MMRTKYFLIFLLATACNRGQTTFVSSAPAQVFAEPSMTINHGDRFTNQELLNVRISDPDHQFEQVTLYEEGHADQPCQDKVSINSNLKCKIAVLPHGASDGEKTIVAELRRDGGDQVKTIRASIGLDTVAPVMVPLGILKHGPDAGRPPRPGDITHLQWSLADGVSVTGYSSGIDPIHGVRVGYSMRESCGPGQYIDISNWVSNQNQISIAWPNVPSATVFFYCVWAQDAAGNIVTLLSQPMSAVWRVLAGAVNQGFGDTATSPDAHYGYPSAMAFDADGNLFIADGHFNNITAVTAKGQKVLIAGNGQNANTVTGSAVDAALPSLGGMALDRQGRIYAWSSGNIVRITRSSDLMQAGRLEIWANGMGGPSSLSIDSDTGTLYFADHLRGNLYSANIDAIDSAFPSNAKRPTKSDFQLFAGNGTHLDRAGSFGNVLASDSADCPIYVKAVSGLGVFYLNNYCNNLPSGQGGMGHAQVRLISRDEKGVLQNRVVANGLSGTGFEGGAHVLEYVESEDGKKTLYVGVNLGLLQIDLTHWKATPLASTSIKAISKGRAVLGIVYDKTANRLFYADTTKAQIIGLNGDGSTHVVYGHDYNNSPDTHALKALLYAPMSVVQTGNGDIYMTEQFKNTISIIDQATGSYNTLIGKPYAETATYKPGVVYPLSPTANVAFADLVGRLAYEPEQNRLYLNYYRSILTLDLNQDKRTLSSLPFAATSSQASYSAWGLTIAPNAEHDLYLVRNSGQQVAQPLGAMTRVSNGLETLVAGNGLLGNIITSTSSADADAFGTPVPASYGMAMDSKLNLYFADSSGTYKLDVKNRISKVSKWSAGASMVLFENPVVGTIDLFGINGLHLRAGTDLHERFCLKGSFFNVFVNGYSQISKGADQMSLLIADSYNNRIIRHELVKDLNGDMMVPPSSCN